MRPMMSQRLDLRQSQSLVMTPQLQQAIKLLQLSNVELLGYVESELEQNPLLERDDSAPTDRNVESGVDLPLSDGGDIAPMRDAADRTSTDILPGDHEAPLDYDATGASDGGGDGTDYGLTESGYQSFGSGGGGFDDRDTTLEQTLSGETSLRDHLLGQLMIDVIDAGDRLIALHLIDSLDEAGYLTISLEDVAAVLGCDLTRVEAMLARVQRFDPAGVAARSLSECLALQLRERNRLDPAMQTLLNNLPMLAQRDAAGLQKICGVSPEDLSDMVAEIRALNPKPGQQFDFRIAQAVTPDILMRAPNGGDWLIELNPDTLPRVLVNARYFAKVNRAGLSKPERDYISERLQSANWLVKSLHQRATTILKVASEIVRQQHDFFQRGVQYLRPLILRDIAEAIGMHESTVSRVTTNKYIATPRGIFELKYFFTSAIPSANGGDAHSAEAVRHRIKLLIDGEASDAVLSDDRIVEILREDRIDIARRTVAKYREALQIPSSVQRRRDKLLRL